MEVWSLINSKNELIRCDILSSDIEFGNLYYFVNNDYSPFWFVDSEKKVTKALFKGDVEMQHCNNYTRPKTERVDIEDYKIIKFKLD
ncbi:hypothetical protein M0Q97_05250 [Candidatus Dojkabacteria bacterium]|jgi:hypothetical protein|nr:hypothetical protein [Candidatus Dojkabacteria bacterium]